MKIGRYVPVVAEVHAVRFLGETLTEQERIADWCNGKLCGTQLHHQDREIEIRDSFGEEERVRYGEWIVKNEYGFARWNDLMFKAAFEPR